LVSIKLKRQELDGRSWSVFIKFCPRERHWSKQPFPNILSAVHFPQMLRGKGPRPTGVGRASHLIPSMRTNMSPRLSTSIGPGKVLETETYSAFLNLTGVRWGDG
jgi:hypothetical protein